VVGAHVEALRYERAGRIGIEHDDVGVGARRELALARVQTEELRRRRAASIDPLLEGEVSIDHALVYECQPRLYARHAARDRAEVPPPVSGESRAAVCVREGAVVGGDDLQGSAQQSLPQLLAMPPVPQRRSAHVARRLRRSPLVAICGEIEVLRTRLGVEGEPPLAGAPNLLERRSARQMNDVTRRLSLLGHARRARHRVGLGARGPRPRVPARLGATLCERLGAQARDRVVVLAVEAHEGPEACRSLQRLEDDVVGHHQALRVGHVQLEARDPRLHHLGHDVVGGTGELGEAHVERVVDARLAVRLGVPPGEALGRRFPPVGGGEVDDRRRPTAGGGARARSEVVRGTDRAYLHVEMGVHVDGAGDDEAPGGVDDLAPLRTVHGADRGHAFPRDEHVGASYAGGRDDVAPRYEEVASSLVWHPSSSTIC
jgi:hypothetical protein